MGKTLSSSPAWVKASWISWKNSGSRDGAFHRNDREQSLITLMIYLNSGFEGGSTDFDLPKGLVSVVPEQGMVLLFHHPLRHFFGRRVQDVRIFQLFTQQFLINQVIQRRLAVVRRHSIQRLRAAESFVAQ